MATAAGESSAKECEKQLAKTPEREWGRSGPRVSVGDAALGRAKKNFISHNRRPPMGKKSEKKEGTEQTFTEEVSGGLHWTYTSQSKTQKRRKILEEKINKRRHHREKGKRLQHQRFRRWGGGG